MDDLVDEVRVPRLVVVGINPSLWTAATGTHFAHPSNRFYRALHRAGITTWELDPRAGLSPMDREHLLRRGMAITNLVRRATARASDLEVAELRAGASTLEERIAGWGPRVVAMAGIGVYRLAYGRARARLGPQPQSLAGARLWVVPNPSGLNAHETVDSLAEWFREAATAAGIVAADRSAGAARPDDPAGPGRRGGTVGDD